MANLTVTFGVKSATAPLEDGFGNNSEDLEIAASPRVTTIEASARQNVVSLFPRADCWVVIALEDQLGTKISNSAAGNERRPLKSGVKEQFACKAGTRVAVIQA